MTKPRSQVPKMDGVLAGSDEPVFRVLPQRVLDDMRKPNTESALLWNLIYPRAQPALALQELQAAPPLWGTHLEPTADALIPYYWGYNQNGQRLEELDRVLEEVDGPSVHTEVDLFLLGESELVLVEAKHMAGLGMCSRYGSKRCPEIHSSSGPGCRYWVEDGAQFSSLLDFGFKPEQDDPSPPCNRHYQLARTALVGTSLAARLDRRLHIWLILPRARWGALRRDWVDFADRIADDQLWRRLRALAWEDIQALST